MQGLAVLRREKENLRKSNGSGELIKGTSPSRLDRGSAEGKKPTSTKVLRWWTPKPREYDPGEYKRSKDGLRAVSTTVFIKLVPT